ncbi:helix-turn-helix transcriptional regulator [Armatimonas sp.]|uniref:helix-turn-helix transcriptional regulator n=1 Tax=Armatimonas sp. TaxID=1872638 RepID=UPI00286CEAD4|nr:helix-turn-helix transcriptional regulator [Armatimonas sp.]
MIAYVIQQARQERQLSLGALALKSGVSKATLSRWEAGKVRPHAPELLKVLEVLEIPEPLCRQCLQQLGTPQAERYLAQMISEDQKLPVSGGELLRALRQRANRSQADTARTVGVTQALLSRWENNDCWPEQDRLRALCLALGATELEEKGLATRAWQNHEELPLDKDALEVVIDELEVAPFDVDLHYLAVASRHWTLYKQNRISESHAVAVWGHFANHLVCHHKFHEGLHVSKRVFDSIRSESHPLSRGQFLALSAMTDALSHTQPQAALEMLLTFESRINARNKSDWCEEIFKKFVVCGQVDRACFYLEQSIQTAPTLARELHGRRQYAEQLCEFGHPIKALEKLNICPSMPQNTGKNFVVYDQAHRALIRGTALHQLGDKLEASVSLQSVLPLLATHPFPGLTRLAHQLTHALSN